MSILTHKETEHRAPKGLLPVGSGIQIFCLRSLCFATARVLVVGQWAGSHYRGVSAHDEPRNFRIWPPG